MAKIDKNIIEQIVSNINIKDLLESDGVKFVKKGQGSYWACCPFHEEKTPSFSVNVKKNSYICFGCHVSGNAINWLREYKKETFLDAVKKLASMCNVDVNINDNKYPVSEEQKKFYQLTNYVNYFYGVNLEKNSIAKKYLKEERCLTAETIKLYKIGYATSGLVKLLEKKYSKDEILDSGICYLHHQTQELKDLLKYRITIPIKDLYGNIVGFCGRNIINTTDYPKYINSPETEFYKKRNILFGLNLAIQHIKSSKTVIIVEGFLDQISLFQEGEKRVVSSMGTALTENQINLVLPHVEKVIFAFDGDNAGKNAAKSALKLFLKLMNDRLTANFVFFDGIDPDDFIKNNSLNEWDCKLNDSISLSIFLMSEIEKESDLKIAEITTIEQKMKILNIANEYMDLVQDAPMYKDLFISHLKSMWK